MIGIYIEYDPLPGQLEGLVRRLRTESEVCMRDDDGCLRMELSLPVARDGRVFLSELWRDQAAIDAHKQRPTHSHAWEKEFVASKRVHIVDVIASPEGR